METKTEFKTLPANEIHELAEAYENHRNSVRGDKDTIISRTPWFNPNSLIEIKTATGRARCRITGEKIAKGETELVFELDYEGNSWTSKTYHVNLAALTQATEPK